MRSPSSPLSPLVAWALAIVATLTMTVSYIDRQALSILAMSVRAALGMDHTQYSVLPAAFSLSYLVGAPLAGWLVDRVGARRGLVASILVWSAVSALHVLVPSFAVLFVLRVALGAAESPSFPGAAQTIRRALPVHGRPLGYSLLFTGSSIGAAIAGPLAIALMVRFGWRLAFVGTSLCGLAWVPLWLVVTGGSRKALLAVPETPAERPPEIPWRDVMRHPAIQRAVVLVFLAAPALMFVYNFSSQLFVEHLHVPERHLDRYLWVAPLMFDAGAVAFGVLLSVRAKRDERQKSHVDVVFTGAILTAALALVAFVRGPVAATLLCGVGVIGAGSLYVAATADMLARVPVQLTSRAGGFTAAAQSLAHIIFSPLVGLVLDHTRSYTPVLVGLGLLALPGAVLWSRWPLRHAA